MIHGFHRQDQSFQLDSGPPWIHSRNGAGFSAEAPRGSTSQARIVAPSSAVAVTSVRVPGSSGTGTGEASSSISPPGVIRTGRAGESTALRSA